MFQLPAFFYTPLIATDHCQKSVLEKFYEKKKLFSRRSKNNDFHESIFLIDFAYIPKTFLTCLILTHARFWITAIDKECRLYELL